MCKYSVLEKEVAFQSENQLNNIAAFTPTTIKLNNKQLYTHLRFASTSKAVFNTGQVLQCEEKEKKIFWIFATKDANQYPVTNDIAM